MWTAENRASRKCQRHVEKRQCLVFKFIRICVDGEIIDSVDGNHFIRFRAENTLFKFIQNSVEAGDLKRFNEINM